MALYQNIGCQPEEVLWQALWFGVGRRVWCRQVHLLQTASGGEGQLQEAHLAQEQDDCKLHLPKQEVVLRKLRCAVPTLHLQSANREPGITEVPGTKGVR